mmetsp:Transcript_21421/g.45632  ORF Transcript_21421/g.45632 Transcript_21421/m.45632 type:complete len:160 (+) Transcript_21421:148-627(+)|eukprot:CAMPEP_0180607590 /NCGR_PEP_ID=MMETSP1037_2-20121125/27794_1 /TAXON_ID=632150 /ORGANISM="Azadinium spinosum, Strain 3D9" /LENGTH=159 /DNA_ID=CAMNT_0022626905 /DNA_START=84 /DNA_END=563 /DNA_ORIENTATION=+
MSELLSTTRVASESAGSASSSGLLRSPPKNDTSKSGTAHGVEEASCMAESSLDAASRVAMWSKGASGHDDGTCRPCAWNYKPSGCINGSECTFCHMCEKDELKRRKKEMLVRRAILKREMKDLHQGHEELDDPTWLPALWLAELASSFGDDTPNVPVPS